VGVGEEALGVSLELGNVEAGSGIGWISVGVTAD